MCARGGAGGGQCFPVVGGEGRDYLLVLPRMPPAGPGPGENNSALCKALGLGIWISISIFFLFGGNDFPVPDKLSPQRVQMGHY